MINDSLKFKIDQLKRDKATYIKTATEVEECVKKYVESMDWCCKDIDILEYNTYAGAGTIIFVIKNCIDRVYTEILCEEFNTSEDHDVEDNHYAVFYMKNCIYLICVDLDGGMRLYAPKQHIDTDATILKIAKETGLHGTIIRSTSEYVTDLLNKNRFPHIADGRPSY